MSNYFTSFQEGGDLLVERRLNDGSSRKSDRKSATAAAAALVAFAASSAGTASGTGSSTTAALHSGHWPEQAMKTCINRLGGNGCWARYCACDDCRPNARRGSTCSTGSIHYDCCLETVTVTDDQLRVTYEVWGLRPSELPIKGTYIDARIVPGFKYWVRYLGGTEQQHHSRLVFPEPVRLRSIGAGYGKRLTFDTKQLPASDSSHRRPHCGHFWSDSCPDGYALSLAALDVGQRFSVRSGGRSGQELGRAAVTWVAPEPAECRLRVGSNAVTARVAVAFKANISLTACRCLLGCHEYEDVPLTGLAWLERPAGSRAVAKVTRIESVRLPDMPELKLVPID